MSLCYWVALSIAVPAIQSSLYERLIVKGNVETGDVLHTRREVWSELYELAKRGGMVGAGYGVSIGSGDFAGGFTVVGYGREKGNSQLAVWEETGIVGLILYALILTTILLGLGSSLLRIRGSAKKGRTWTAFRLCTWIYCALNLRGLVGCSRSAGIRFFLDDSRR